MIRPAAILAWVLAMNLIAWAGAQVGEHIDRVVTTTAGATVKIPSDRPAVVLCVRPEQPQSQSAIHQAMEVIGDSAEVARFAVVSGADADKRAKDFAAASRWPVLADADHDLSGALGVHAWPTTIVIDAKGIIVAHLAGLDPAYSSTLAAAIDLAVGKIDRPTYEKRIAQTDEVVDDPHAKARRHATLATTLFIEGKTDAAAGQVEMGLKLIPADASLLIARARIELRRGDAEAMLKTLDLIPKGSVPGIVLATLRARALIHQEKWADAKTLIAPTIKLNPDPAEAMYLLGLVAQHEGDMPAAAAWFRKAFESADRLHAMP